MQILSTQYLSDGECSPLFTLLGPEMAIFKPGERVNPGLLTIAIEKQISFTWSEEDSNMIGILSNSNGSENVTQKVKLCCFQLHRPYSNSFNLSNVGDFCRS